MGHLRPRIHSFAKTDPSDAWQFPGHGGNGDVHKGKFPAMRQGSAWTV